MQLDIELVGLEDLLRQMKDLLPDQEMKKILRKLANRAVTLNRQRIRKQENLDGSKFQKKADGSNDKMLENVFRQKKRKQFKVSVNQGNDTAKVTMLNPVTKKIHFGESSTFKLRNPGAIKDASGGIASRRFKKNDPCTAEQARLLRSQMGFAYSTSDLQKRFTRFHAESVLIKHYQKYGGVKTIHQPNREVLGLNKKMELALYETLKKHIAKILPDYL